MGVSALVSTVMDLSPLTQPSSNVDGADAPSLANVPTCGEDSDTNDVPKWLPRVAEIPSPTNYFIDINPIVHVLRGGSAEKREAATPIARIPIKALNEPVIEENDQGKIGFTVDVAMRLVAERLADQDFGSPVSYLEQKTPPDLADSA